MADGIAIGAVAAAFDRGRLAGELAEAARQRESVVAAFPLGGWPVLPLERYALGLGQRQPPFCAMIEFHTDALGSIRGAAPPSTSCTATTPVSGGWRRRCGT